MGKNAIEIFLSPQEFTGRVISANSGFNLFVLFSTPVTKGLAVVDRIVNNVFVGRLRTVGSFGFGKNIC